MTQISFKKLIYYQIKIKAIVYTCTGFRIVSQIIFKISFHFSRDMQNIPDSEMSDKMCPDFYFSSGKIWAK